MADEARVRRRRTARRSDGVDRRVLLGSLAALVVGSSGLMGGFAMQPPLRQLLLREAWHSARRGSQSLLVVVVPAEAEERYVRGRIVGASLMEAMDPLLDLLADYTPCCASMADLQLLGVPPMSEQAWFVIVPAMGPLDAAVAIDGPAGLASEAPAVQQLPFITRTAVLLSRVLRRQRPTTAPAGESPEARVRRARERWVDHHLPASFWANDTGCGLHVEDQLEWIGDRCGMGQVPERAKRFLLFLEDAA